MIDIPQDWDGLAIQADENIEQTQNDPGFIRLLLGRLAARYAGRKNDEYFREFFFDDKGRVVPVYTDRHEMPRVTHRQPTSHLDQ